MTGKGRLTRTPNRRLKLFLAFHALWLVLLFLLGAWWGILLSRQAARIAELERIAGLATKLAESHWMKTQRMLYWESLAFFAFILVGAALLFWLYWRDARRAKSLQAFFASVTHELRTPLTSIRLQAESIAESVTTQENETLIRRLLEDTLRLESQVDRTLELARIEGGGPMFTQPVQLGPWLQRLMKPWIDAYGGKLQVNYRLNETHPVRADMSAMQVILRNLLENSVRHSGKEPVQIELSTEIKGGGVTLRFRDDGRGFEGDAHRLGQLFQKGASSSGAGVGLYLIRVLMERMGGAVAFRSSDGFEASLWFKEAADHG